MLNFTALPWPQGFEKKKKKRRNFGSQFATLGANVPACINILM
jgi:hypothetical protein